MGTSLYGRYKLVGNEMIPFIKEFIEMNLRGEFQTWELAAYVVKQLSKSCLQSDFDELPDWLKAGVREEIDSYRASGGWIIFRSNSEPEDYAPYADDVIRKFDLSK